MPPELGRTLRVKAWLQAISLSNDGKQTLYHLVLRVDAATLGSVIVNESQLDALTSDD